ncbi:MAG: lysoplasmalogenase family protein, partial [Turicibacter sp.]
MSCVFIIIYLIMCVGHLWFCYVQKRQYQRLTKVMLMPLLLLFVMSTPATGKSLIIGALIFGFLGDACLLYEKKNIF